MNAVDMSQILIPNVALPATFTALDTNATPNTGVLRDGSGNVINNTETVNNLVVNTSITEGIATITGAGTVNTTTTLCNAAGGAFTATLPSAAGNKGLFLRVKKIDSSGNAVTVQASSGNIDNSATFSLPSANSKVSVQSDGANWWTV